MNESEYKAALKRSEYLMDLEEHGVEFTAKLALELDELMSDIIDYEKDMI